MPGWGGVGAEAEGSLGCLGVEIGLDLAGSGEQFCEIK